MPIPYAFALIVDVPKIYFSHIMNIPMTKNNLSHNLIMYEAVHVHGHEFLCDLKTYAYLALCCVIVLCDAIIVVWACTDQSCVYIVLMIYHIRTNHIWNLYCTFVSRPQLEISVFHFLHDFAHNFIFYCLGKSDRTIKGFS